MLKKTLTLAMAIVIAMAAGTASAQCVIGVYGDADGTVGYIQPTELQTFDVYVVLFTEDLVNGVAYQMSVPDLNVSLFLQGTPLYGPDGSGIGLMSPPGSHPAANDVTVGLGVCAVGFNGLPILVAQYSFAALASFSGGSMSVGPNTFENPASVVYSDCQGVVKTCDGSVALTVDSVIPNASTSMGAVKSLYN